MLNPPVKNRLWLAGMLMALCFISLWMPRFNHALAQEAPAKDAAAKDAAPTDEKVKEADDAAKEEAAKREMPAEREPMAPEVKAAIERLDVLLKKHTYKEKENTIQGTRTQEKEGFETLPGKGNTWCFRHYYTRERWGADGVLFEKAFAGYVYTVPLDKFSPEYLRVLGPFGTAEGPIKSVESFSIRDEAVVRYRFVQHGRSVGPYPFDYGEDKTTLHSSFALTLKAEPWVDEVAAEVREIVTLGRKKSDPPAPK